MDKKLFKLPFLSLIGGIVFYAIIFLLNFLGYGVTFNPLITKILIQAPLILNILILIIIGMILRKSYDRKTFFKSITLLVIYSFVLLIMQQVMLHFGIENLLVDFILYLPIAIFGIISSLLVKDNNTEIIKMIILIVSLFEPYLLMLFSKEY